MRYCALPLTASLLVLLLNGCITKYGDYEYHCISTYHLNRHLKYPSSTYPPDYLRIGPCSISGSILDRSNQPIPGALVAIKTKEQNQLYGTRADLNGNFTINGVPESKDCTITIEASGYECKKYRHLALNTSKSLSLTVNLEAIGDFTGNSIESPNQAVQRTRTASAVHDYHGSCSTAVPASADGKR
jgi:hypothetical protein